MILLRELVQIHRQSTPKYFNSFLPKDTKLRQLYDLICEQEHLQDHEAAFMIYQTSNKDKRYLMLKKNLINRLSDMLVVYEEEGVMEDIDSEMLYSKQQLLLVDLLLRKNVYHNAEKILLKLLRRAQRNLLNGLSVECYRYLQIIASLKGSARQIQKLMTEKEQVDILVEAENKARNGWLRIQAMGKFCLSFDEEIAEVAETLLQQSGIWCFEKQSLWIGYYKNKIEQVAAYHGGELELFQQKVLSMKDIFTRYPLLSTEANQREYYFHYARSLQMQGEVKRALAVVEEILPMTSYAAFDRYEVQALHFDLLMKLKQPIEAAKVMEEVMDSCQYGMLQSVDQSAWLLKEAYLIFWGKLHGIEKSIRSYLRNFPEEITPDLLREECKAAVIYKESYNVQFLILNSLLEIEQREVDCYKMFNNMKMYYLRYLKNSKDMRTQQFFQQFYKSFFQLYQGREVIFDEPLVSGFSPVEIIPYEELIKGYLACIQTYLKEEEGSFL
ncbi:hypothetical protein [Algivirga pacifica]|uniref:Uncharacterized protein n=1 Tax=Algivirga pacifica TaxID=1162670 RepID=A0ABP9D281_9BACT